MSIECQLEEICDKLVTVPCKWCDNRLFFTSATLPTTITAISVGGVDASAKFTLPFTVNNSLELENFRQELIACLDAEGVTHEFIFGRDGWNILWTGPEIELTTVVDGTEQVQTSCNEVIAENVLLVEGKHEAAILGIVQEILDCLKPAVCPTLLVDPAAYTTDSANGATGTPVTFPVTSPPNETSDFAVPIALPADLDCLEPTSMIKVRWYFDHSIDPSSGHTGFSVGATDGVDSWAVTASSNGTAVHVGPGYAPHSGPRQIYWAEIDIPYSALSAGVVLQTSAFGTITSEVETVHNQWVELITNLDELGCCE